MIKKIIFLSIIFSVLLFSCSEGRLQEGTVPESDYSRPVIAVTEDELETASAKAVLRYLNAYYNAVDVMIENGLKIPASVNERGEDTGKEYGFTDLLELMPQSRSEEEFERFNTELSSAATWTTADLIPDYTKALEAGLIDIDEESGSVITSFDTSVSLNSVEGIMAVETANFMADGMSLGEAMDKVQRDVQKVIGANDNSRGYYISNVGRWPNGKIMYYFDDDVAVGPLREAYKNYIRSAMKEWNEKTNGLIKFEEVSKASAVNANGENNASYKLGYVVRIVNYKAANSSTMAQSHVGHYDNFVSEMSFDDSKVRSDRQWSIAHFAAKHELGHLIGLQHEFERPDVGKYLENTESVKEKNTVVEKWFVIEYQEVKNGNVKTTVPVIVEKQREVSVNNKKCVGIYDFYSVTNYEGLVVKQPYAKKYFGKRNVIYQEDLYITANDVKTVKQMYSSK